MAKTDTAFETYISEINKAYSRGDATEHTHRPALKNLIESIDDKFTAINEPKRIACGAPDLLVTFKKRTVEQSIGYIEAKDIGLDLNRAEKDEQIKKRYLPSLENLILTDYTEFRLYINGEKHLTARLAEETGGKFKITSDGIEKVTQLLNIFLSHKPLKIGGAKELTKKMGDIAKLLRNIIENTFEQEQETGTLHNQYGAFKEVLIHDLTKERFADMYAQTICYGLFSARCHIGDDILFGKDKYSVFHGIDEKRKQFTRETAAYLLPKTNPFLRKIFGHIAGPELDERIAWLVDDLVALLRNADMSGVLKDFAKKTKRRDPVFHFYETFLAEYDKKLKKSRGVYYTPDEVVSYIVRSVDILLKEKFGLQQGLADKSKITIEIGEDKEKEKKEVHRCLILDPAVGTGTFLHEVIEQIYSKFKQQKGSWSGYVKDHLLPRIFGFELMMAPYAICHMKLGLQLANTEYDFGTDERLGVYMTNTLEEAEVISKTVFAQGISEEARAANKVKKDLPIMIVLGNPPYKKISANMNKWIDGLLKNKLPVENGAQSYYQIDGQPLDEKKLWVQDDYIKFIRFGQYRIEQSSSGILAFITNHGFLDNPTLRGMRQSLLQTFDEIYLLDLHGNQDESQTYNDREKDENVFDSIKQGVSIGIFLKSGLDTKDKTNIYHKDFYGLRKNKYKWLEENDINTTEWAKLKPNSPSYFFVPRDETSRKDYEIFWDIREIINKTSVGVVTARDKLTINFLSNDLWLKINDFVNLSSEIARSKFELGKDARDWKVQFAQKDIMDSGPNPKYLKPIIYRPFDKRFTYYTGKSRGFIGQPQINIMQHMFIGENIGLCWTRPMSPQYEFSVTISTSIVDQCLVGNKSAGAGTSYLGPIYLYPTEKHQSDFDYENWPRGINGRVPNLDKEFVEELTGKIGLKFGSDGCGDLKKDFGPEDILAYIYGIFHSPEYRKRYAQFLKIDFPRVPMPPNKEMFVKICRIGQELIKLHLLEAKILEDEKQWPRFGVKGSGIVEKGYPEYNDNLGRVYINKEQYFEGVEPEVWEFCIGGYQVCEKWLKDRRERTLSYDEQNHYQKIVVALRETGRLMQEKCLSEFFEKN